MMKKYMADFETVNDPNDCRVWAWAVVEIGNLDYREKGKDIDSFLEWAHKESRQIFFS